MTNNIELENARIGYQAVVSLWVYEGSLIWARFNAMLVANGIILATIGVILSSDRVPPELVIAPSVLGFFLCVVWSVMVALGFDWYKYWIWSARELEEQFISDPVKTASRGGDFAERKQVTFTISGEPRSHQIGCYARLVRMRHAAYLVILAFTAVYIMTASAVPFIVD